ncbi:MULTISPECIES: hypothetical protein [Bacillaceae]|uniref:hypothetical protein n=1 Tax=Bacillaceae TaxID=186817 RepID=UPI0029653582|nr:hypothetical protein [Bacillus infantis]MDW2879574.1 hypothetical protein [Bacillus infantis]
MVVEQALEAARKYKKHLENMNPWTYFYSKNNNKFWGLNFTKNNENTGFFIFCERPAMSSDILEAYWNLSTASSLINVVTKEMSVSYNKSLKYLKDLEKLLIHWKENNPAETEQFKLHIEEYLRMVKFYEHGKAETKRLHSNLLDIENTMLQGVLTDKETEAVILNSAEYNFYRYTELHMQKSTIKGISEIDKWLKKNRKITDFFSKTRKLLHYTDYYINPKSVGYIDESLEDFSFGEKSSGDLVYDMDWNEGKALFTERYIKQLRIIFEKDFIPMLRNPI